MSTVNKVKNIKEWNLDFKYAVAENFELKLQHIWESTCTGVFGPSGSGKTSLIEVLLGVGNPSKISGRIQIGGQSLCDTNYSKPTYKRRVSWIPQEPSLFPHLSVLQNIQFPYISALRNPLRKKTIGPPNTNGCLNTDLMIETLGIKELLGCYPQELSGGQRQRVALAQALNTNSFLVLMDEPLNSLDSQARNELIDALKDLIPKSNKMFLYISHEPEEILSLCDHVLCLKSGELVDAGDPVKIIYQDSMGQSTSTTPPVSG